MRPDNKPVDHFDQAEVLEAPDRPPVSSFATPWIGCDQGFFWVHVSIVGPQSKKPEGYFPLSVSKAEAILQAVPDLIKSLEEDFRG